MPILSKPSKALPPTPPKPAINTFLVSIKLYNSFPTANLVLIFKLKLALISS